jgi:hypothetical protein
MLIRVHESKDRTKAKLKHMEVLRTKTKASVVKEVKVILENMNSPKRQASQPLSKTMKKSKGGATSSPPKDH